MTFKQIGYMSGSQGENKESYMSRFEWLHSSYHSLIGKTTYYIRTGFLNRYEMKSHQRHSVIPIHIVVDYRIWMFLKIMYDKQLKDEGH